MPYESSFDVDKKQMIRTKNLNLLPCGLPHFRAILRGGREIESLLGVTQADGWLGFPDVVEYACEYLKTHPSALKWWTYLFIHSKDKVLIGFGGFKGEADESGKVEIGYEIAPGYRNRGLATEAARGMIDYAFSHPHVKSVEAHTLAESSASTKVLEKVGMKYVGVVRDSEDGEIWRWRLMRED